MIDGAVDLALVGAGRMGRTHLRALLAAASLGTVASGTAGGVRIRHVVEPVPAVREALADAGVEVHGSLEELLDRARPDGVLVAAPTDRHAAIVRLAVRSGLPVLCEKPAGLSAAEVEETSRLAAECGVPLQVAYWRRFVPALVRLRERIAAGELGTVLHVECAQWDAAPPPVTFRASSGGIFADMGVHEFDEIRWLLGEEVVDVRAAATPAVDVAARPDVDNAQALLTLSGGGTAVASLGRHHPVGDLVSVEVFGTLGHERVIVLDPGDGERAMLDALARQASAFADVVRGGPRAGAGIDDAVAALDIAERAARDGLEI